MGLEANKRRIFFNCASGAAESIVNVCVAVWVNQYLVKRISAEEYSLYPVLSALLVFMPLLTTILTSGLGRYVAEAHAKGDDRRVTQIVSTMFPLLLGVSVILMAIGVLFALHIDSVLTIAPDQVSDARIMISLLIFSASLRFAIAPFGVGLYARQKFVLLSSLTTCYVLMRAALLFALLIGVNPAVVWLVVAMVTADLVILPVTVIFSKRALPALSFRWREVRWDLVNVLTTFGFWNMVGYLAYLIRKSSDPLILNKLSTPQNVTSFYLGNLPDAQIEATAQKAALPLQPAMVELHARGRKQQLQNYYLRGGRYALWVTLFVATPLIIFRNEFWSLYLGRTYHLYSDASIVMALLLARYWISYPNEMIYNVAHAINAVKPVAIRCIFAALANLALTLYLVGVLKLGAVGAAVGTFLTAIIWEPLIMWQLSLGLLGLSFGKWFKETIWPGVLPGAVAAIFSLSLRVVTQPDSWMKLAIVVSCGCAVYLGTLLALCLKADERQDLVQFMAQVRTLALSASRTEGAS